MKKVLVIGLAIGGICVISILWVPQAIKSYKDIFPQVDQLISRIFPVEDRVDEDAAREAYARSIELLSAGKQWEAEDLIEATCQRNPDDRKILFAHAVLKRSYWSKIESTKLFSACSEGNDYWALAAQLALLLDLHESVDECMKELVELSDEYPDDVYLLWLSAIECREQKMGELGKERYELLLNKFDVGPFLLHQSYANILDEQLHDYEAALVHRRIALSMSSAESAVQGMANTLMKMERYSEALEYWEKLLKKVSDDEDYWERYGFVLMNMERFSNAIAAYEKAVELDAGNSEYWRQLGECHKKLGHDDEAVDCYQKAAALGADVSNELAEYTVLQQRDIGEAELPAEIRQQILQDAEFLMGLSKESYQATSVRLANGTTMITSFQRLGQIVSVCEEEDRIDLAVATQERLIALCKYMGFEQKALDIMKTRQERLKSILKNNVSE